MTRRSKWERWWLAYEIVVALALVIALVAVSCHADIGRDDVDTVVDVTGPVRAMM